MLSIFYQFIFYCTFENINWYKLPLKHSCCVQKVRIRIYLARMRENTDQKNSEYGRFLRFLCELQYISLTVQALR